MSRAQQRLLGVGMALAGAGLMVFGLYQVGHATGLLGVRGTLTVRSCALTGAGRNSHMSCTGSFRPDSESPDSESADNESSDNESADDGSSDDAAATVGTNPPLAAGTALRVDRVGPGDYVRIDISRTEDWLAGTALGAMFLAAGGAALTSRAGAGSLVSSAHRRTGGSASRWRSACSARRCSPAPGC
ncbi:hypothetical protein GXW82_32000 [Streptacidiphilus sp. 4-A2]|nr:hypothetical protein [Streptacidiphilus sp. 4-A2]